MKRRQFDLCILCGESPCICNQAVVPTKSSKVQDQGKNPTKSQRTKKLASLPTGGATRDLSLESALRNLLPILHSSEKPKVERMLNAHRTAEVERKLHEWRDKNAP